MVSNRLDWNGRRYLSVLSALALLNCRYWDFFFSYLAWELLLWRMEWPAVFYLVFFFDALAWTWAWGTSLQPTYFDFYVAFSVSPCTFMWLAGADGGWVDEGMLECGGVARVGEQTGEIQKLI